MNNDNKPMTKCQNWIFTEEKEPLHNIKAAKISILDLPEEIILYIFSYLDNEFLLQKIALVCKTWSRLAKDPMLWISLSLDMKMQDFNLKSALLQFPYLQKLIIQQGTIDNGFVEAMTFLSKLWFLSLTFCDILSEAENAFEKFFEKNSLKLKYLDFEGSEVNREILSKICNLKSLRHLNLSHCIYLANETLLKVLENSPHLQFLDLDGINFLKDRTVNSIFTLRSDSILDLSIDGDYLTDQAFENLKNCSKLVKLNISFCDNLTDITLFEIKDLRYLKNLKLRKGSNFTARGLTAIFKDGNLSSITHLNLSECSLLDDSTLIAIANCCSGLVSISLGWCWELTDESLCYLIKKCPLIKTMDLTGLFRLQGDFLSDLKQGYLKDLKVIDLEQCGCVKDESLLDLFHIRSNIKIFGFWGDIVSTDSSENDTE